MVLNAAALLTCGRDRVNFLPMDMDDFLRARPDDPLALLSRQDLDPLSVDELGVRIALLEAEILRSRDRMERARNHRTTADALFRKS